VTNTVGSFVRDSNGHMIHFFREMADYTITWSVNIKTGNKVRNIVSNRLYRFEQQTNMEKVFDEVVYPEELRLKVLQVYYSNIGMI
jgi:hypothetical protein